MVSNAEATGATNRKIMKNEINNHPRLVLDFETFYSDTYNLSRLNYQEYVHASEFKVHGLAVAYPDGTCCFRADVPVLLRELRDQYGEHLEKTVVVMHNAVFDAYILKEQYGQLTAMIADTMLMARGLFGLEESGSLQNLAEKFHLPAKMDLNFSKGKHELSPVDFAQLRTYAINDVVLTGTLYDRMLPKMSETELHIINHTVQCFLREDIQIDATLLHQAKRELISGVTKKIAPLNREEVSRDSSFCALLTTYLSKTDRIIPCKNGEHGPIAAIDKNDPAMQKLAMDDDPTVRTLCRSRLLVGAEQQLLSRLNYLIGTSNLTGGRVPVYLKYYGAQTGRFAGGNGLNLQNLPVPGRSPVQILNDTAWKIRQSIHAPAGYVFVAVDASQIEARVLAWLTKEEQLNSAFASGRDIYSEFASEVFKEPAGKPCDDSPAEQRKGLLRQIGKTAILGLGYQMGARHFAQQLANFADITQLCGSEIESKRLAWKIVNSYRNQYRAIPGFWKKLEKEFRASVTSRSFRKLGRLVIASDNRATWVTLPSGRKLIYQATAILPTCIQEISYLNSQGEQVTTPMEQQPLCYHDGKNLHGGLLTENVVQAIARDLLVRVILECEKAGIPIVLHIHDEVIACVPEVQAKQAMEKMIQIWRTVPQWAEGLVLDAEGVIGINLAGLK